MYERAFRIKKKLLLLIFISALLVLISGANTDSSYAAPDTLEIRICYSGYPSEVKKTFNRSELSGMSQMQAYTLIDQLPSVVLCSAKGVRLDTLLKNAGVDLASAQRLRFFTHDSGASWYRKEYTANELLYGTRYYYPNLSTCWDPDLHAPLQGWEVGKQQVPTMISVEDNWTRWGAEPNYAGMSNKESYRLLFGQTNVNANNAQESAKYIYAIEVVLSGAPPPKGGVAANDPATVGSDASGGTIGDMDDSGDDASKGNDKSNGKDGMAGLQVADGTGSKVPFRVYELSNDAAALEKPETDTSMLPATLASFLVCFFLGAILEYRKFKREVKF